MSRPREARNLVLTPTRVPARLRLHFEKNEIVEAHFIQMPGCAQTGHASANDDDGHARLPGGPAELAAVPEAVSCQPCFINELAFDAALGFGGEADETGAEA